MPLNAMARTTRSICGLSIITLLAFHTPASGQSRLSAGLYGDIIEQAITIHQSHLDVSGPESASLVALGLEPFITALPVAPPDLSGNAVIGHDERGRAKAGLAVDFSPYALFKSRDPLKDYQDSPLSRVLYRTQLSVAVSRAAFNDDEGLRAAPALRIVFHNRRDPRVHRGPGSLLNCLIERSNPPPPEWVAQLEGITRALNQPVSATAAGAAARKVLQDKHDRLYSQLINWAAIAVRASLPSCRNETNVARYGWNPTALAGGIAPVFTAKSNSETQVIVQHAYTSWTAWLTGSYGFDPQSNTSGYQTTWAAAHIQLLGQAMYQSNERISLTSPATGEIEARTDRLTFSGRLRFGLPDCSASVETALMHENRRGLSSDTYTRISAGGDFRVTEGLWLTVSAGRTLGRAGAQNVTQIFSRPGNDETIVRVALKWVPLDLVPW